MHMLDKFRVSPFIFTGIRCLPKTPLSLQYPFLFTYITEACITAYYESFPVPPTGSPTDVGETNGGFYPDYDLLWVDGFCINTKPIPSGRPTYISMLSCCQAAYAGQTSRTFSYSYVVYSFHDYLWKLIILYIFFYLTHTHRGMHGKVLQKLSQSTHWISYRLGRGSILS